VNKIDLVQHEQIEKTLTPHPLSFLYLHSLWIGPLMWGILLLWLFHSSHWNFQNGTVDSGMGIAMWFIGLIVFGVISSLILIRWRVLVVYCALCTCGVILLWNFNIDDVRLFLPLYTVLLSFIGFPLVEVYRRSHCYFITTFRLVLKGGIIRTKERSLRYEKISDIEGSQSIFGKLCRYGTIIPVTQSGFGLGDDVTFAGGGSEGGKKIRLFGFAGGSRGVATPRTRSYYELHGVHPYREVKAMIDTFLHQHTVAPYQMEQVKLQKEILNVLRERKNEDTF
jgi:hypothetical protein